MMLSGWGRYPRIDCRVVTPRDEGDAAAAVRAAGNSGLIARGNGRSYGDAALNRRATLSMLRFDRLLAFDPETGRLTCEAGVLLSDILDTFVPRGWFPAVTPGTRFVTVGGAIAADVHGKNHHKDGSFVDHVDSLDLLLEDGRVITCGPDREPELFTATRGGMGLTGTILRATLRLRPITTAWIRQETVRAPDLDTIMGLFEESVDWTYTVAWIDCLARSARLGRSLLFRGEHAEIEEVPADRRERPLATPRHRTISVPCDAPPGVLNRWTVAAFNAIYYRLGTPGTAIVGAWPFFYPLDSLLDWNRIYGGAGFVQYQCVLPKPASAVGIRALLEAVARAGRGSFLAVLKLLGKQNELMAFPMEGYTLALDFPANAPTFSFLNELDAIVADHGGRLYLAKDARMGTGLLHRGYPGLAAFRDIRVRWNPAGSFRSLQAERLAL